MDAREVRPTGSMALTPALPGATAVDHWYLLGDVEVPRRAAPRQ
ncbi:hypothetical protein AB0F03_03045 [Streptomyces sp. NPDC028722]